MSGGPQLQNMRPTKRMKTVEEHAVTASAEFGFWGDLTQDLANDGFALQNVADGHALPNLPPQDLNYHVSGGFVLQNPSPPSLPNLVVPRVSAGEGEGQGGEQC
jgi:hypothetical protein